jgi:hypothetical protein
MCSPVVPTAVRLTAPSGTDDVSMPSPSAPRHPLHGDVSRLKRRQVENLCRDRYGAEATQAALAELAREQDLELTHGDTAQYRDRLVAILGRSA